MNNLESNKRNNRRRLSKRWHVIIEGLMVNNEPLFFQALYQAMIEHPTYVILSDMESERKCDILAQMLKYYEKREDYEKCAKLLEIQKQVNDNLC
tara:strand:- start:804 stop:1088 length:285 start_codon:yes stop_codon:yes gene_type:complete